MKHWKNLKNILCIRPDNMGDVLMAEPSLRALKHSFPDAKITLLTSKSASLIAPFISSIDDVVAEDLPWVKNEKDNYNADDLIQLAQKLSSKKFDASVIFTNYSQNPLPSVMLAYLARIPKRLSYLRENAYSLLTDWVRDVEPFNGIKHGVIRNLELVRSVGCTVYDPRIKITNRYSNNNLTGKLLHEGIDFKRPWIIVHPFVRGDEKRVYSTAELASSSKKLSIAGYQIIVTGEEKDNEEAQKFVNTVGPRAFNLAGKTNLSELISLINQSPLLISNNTGIVHIASALKTPVLVLYARTNMEHTPWMVDNEVLYFDPKKKLQSSTPILFFSTPKDVIKYPTDDDIIKSALRLLSPLRRNKENKVLAL